MLVHEFQRAVSLEDWEHTELKVSTLPVPRQSPPDGGGRRDPSAPPGTPSQGSPAVRAAPRDALRGARGARPGRTRAPPGQLGGTRRAGPAASAPRPAQGRAAGAMGREPREEPRRGRPERVRPRLTSAPARAAAAPPGALGEGPPAARRLRGCAERRARTGAAAPGLGPNRPLHTAPAPGRRLRGHPSSWSIKGARYLDTAQFVRYRYSLLHSNIKPALQTASSF